MFPAAAGPAPAPLPAVAGRPYVRRRPEATTLYQVVREHLNSLYAATEAGFGGTPLPPFVRRELEGYLDCGIACRGFARLRCESCAATHIVSFSCKGRAFCPSCMGRRMAQIAANLQDHVLPPEVPLRQWVLTLPHPLRARLAYDGPLLGAVCRIFVDTVLGWYRRRMELAGARDGQGGAVTVVQRSSSDLKLNPHFHAVFLDGVFVKDADGKPAFRQLPHISTTAVADVLQLSRIRILRFLRGRGVVDVDDAATVLPGDLADREPALAQLAAAAVSGLPPAGPVVRRKPIVVALSGRPGVVISSHLCVDELGFGLHAATTAGALDTAGREALLKYVLRPPVSQERVVPGAEGRVRILFRKAWKDGTTAVEMHPLSLLSRLAAAVPPPRLHTVRYAGVLAPAAQWRSDVIPPLPPQPAHAATPDGANDKPTHRCRYRPWAQLLKRTFKVDVESCPTCGGRMRLLAMVTDKHEIARFLRHLGQPTEPPSRAPARGPPWPWDTRRVERIRDDLADAVDTNGFAA